jgi:GntR family transcriptional regulator, transcriptional repressor for pyruvate dehydrogenase complex
VVTWTPLTRAQHLADELERSIRQRSLQPGERITTMDELREQTGLARSTISEAARLLAERGSVVIKPGRGGGLFVAQADPVVRLRHTLLSVPSGSTTVADAIAVREALEELIDVDAANHRSATDAADLGRALSRLRRATRLPGEFLRRNWELHERIAMITPNAIARGVYIGTLRYITELPARIDSGGTDLGEGYLEHRLKVHAELVEAIVAGDAGRTAKAVHQHSGLARELADGAGALT